MKDEGNLFRLLHRNMRKKIKTNIIAREARWRQRRLSHSFSITPQSPRRNPHRLAGILTGSPESSPESSLESFPDYEEKKQILLRAKRAGAKGA